MTALDVVRDATWPLHRQAERSGIIARIVAGTASRSAVALFWRNLLPVYEILDTTGFARPELRRTEVIRKDLTVLAPEEMPPLLPEGTAFAEALRAGSDAGVLSHAYTRYLGDLRGGQIMGRRLALSLGDIADRLGFNAYPAIADTSAYAAAYRKVLDEAAARLPETELIQETEAAFRRNIALSEAVVTACG